MGGRATQGSEEHLVSVVVDDQKIITGTRRTSRTSWVVPQEYPPPELMTVHDAAAYFSVQETSLRNALTIAGIPVQGKDSWGVDLYRRTDIQELLGR